MKRLLYFLVLASLIISCGDDDNPVSDNVLQYDGQNANSPIFEAGSHEAAARFPSFITNDLDGKGIASIDIFVYDVPREFYFNVYSGGSAAGPGQLIFSEEVSAEMQPNRFNLLTFDPPIPIDGELWLSASWTQISTQQVIGCDAGPANPNGDWLFLSTDNENWSTFRDRGGESVNWNIRGNLVDL